jgi:hypothetical protein
MGISLHFSKRDICEYEVTSKYIKGVSPKWILFQDIGGPLVSSVFLNFLMFLDTLEF